MAIEPVGVGKVVTDLADSSVGKALLLPTATSLGKYLGERTEAWVHRRREKRLRNIAVHVECFEQTFKKDPFETSDDKSLFDWLEGVADVDPENEELSRIWRAALGRLDEGGLRRRRLLRLVKELSDEDAGFINSIARRPQMPRQWVSVAGQRDLKNRLIRAGFFYSNAEGYLSIARWAAVFTGFWAFVVVIGLIMALAVAPHLMFETFAMFVLLSAASALSFGFLQSRGYLTQDGKELVAWVRRVQLADLHNDPSVRQTAAD